MKGGALIKRVKEILLNSFLRISATFACLLFLFVGILLVIRLCVEADKSSAFYALEHSDLLISAIVMFPIYLVWNLLVLSIEIMSIFFSNYELSEKITSRLYKFGILVALVVAMLYTETPDQFQLLATLISFCLIFNFLVPNDLPKLFIEVKRNAQKKRAKCKRNKEN